MSVGAAPLDEAKILQALRTVQDPELHVDIVTLGMIEDLATSDDKVMSIAARVGLSRTSRSKVTGCPSRSTSPPPAVR